MPELPEVETVRRGLEPVLEGALIRQVEQRRPDLRFPLPENFAARLGGRRVRALGRRAKYLIAWLDDGQVLVCHLGMSGSFRVEAGEGAHAPGLFHHPRNKAAAHDHVVFHVEGPAGKSLVTFNDPRRFGFMFMAASNALDSHPMLAGLGVEPTGNALDGALLADLLRGRRTPLKAALLDQRLIAGLGNIYVCEALWRAGLSPRRSAGSVAGAIAGRATMRSRRLADAIRAVIAEAIEAGGSTLRDHMLTDGSLGYFQHRFAVYDREGEPCPRAGCGGVVLRFAQAGRSTFHCPACQR